MHGMDDDPSPIFFIVIIFFLMGGCTGSFAMDRAYKNWMLETERAYYNPATGDIIYESPRKEPQSVDQYFGEPTLEAIQ